jgi:PilZ domain
VEQHKSSTTLPQSNLPRTPKALEDGSAGFGAGALFVIMPQKLMEVLTLGRCSHAFSWPRRAANGDYYQVCLLCATTYQYDWKTMRRGDRVDEPVAEIAVPRRSAQKEQTSWMPRARRLHVKIAIRYRVKSLSAWHEGIIQDISQSGVLFHGPQSLPAKAMVEMIFEMPEEISGQKDSTVLCQGTVIRVKDAVANGDDAFALVASILDYKFLKQD